MHLFHIGTKADQLHALFVASANHACIKPVFVTEWFHDFIKIFSGRTDASITPCAVFLPSGVSGERNGGWNLTAARHDK